MDNQTQKDAVERVKALLDDTPYANCTVGVRFDGDAPEDWRVVVTTASGVVLDDDYLTFPSENFHETMRSMGDSVVYY